MSGQASVLYFASLRDAAGVSSEVVAAGGDLAGLYDVLRAKYGFALERERLRVAVDGEFADWREPVRPGSQIAFIPPVSGG